MNAAPERAEAPATRRRMVVAPDSVPRLARGVMLRFDQARQRHVLLVPERVLAPDETAVEVLQLCDGTRSLSDIAATLAEKYTAPVDDILADIMALIADLAEPGFVIDARGSRT